MRMLKDGAKRMMVKAHAFQEKLLLADFGGFWSLFGVMKGYKRRGGHEKENKNSPTHPNRGCTKEKTRHADQGHKKEKTRHIYQGCAKEKILMHADRGSKKEKISSRFLR